MGSLQRVSVHQPFGNLQETQEDYELTIPSHRNDWVADRGASRETLPFVLSRFSR
jgi:hypothetical protein